MAEAYVAQCPRARDILADTLQAIDNGDAAAARDAMNEAEEGSHPRGASYTGLMLLIRRAAAAQGMRSLAADAGQRVKVYRAGLAQRRGSRAAVRRWAEGRLPNSS